MCVMHGVRQIHLFQVQMRQQFVGARAFRSHTVGGYAVHLYPFDLARIHGRYNLIYGCRKVLIVVLFSFAILFSLACKSFVSQLRFDILKPSSVFLSSFSSKITGRLSNDRYRRAVNEVSEWYYRSTTRESDDIEKVFTFEAAHSIAHWSRTKGCSSVPPYQMTLSDRSHQVHHTENLERHRYSNSASTSLQRQHATRDSPCKVSPSNTSVTESSVSFRSACSCLSITTLIFVISSSPNLMSRNADFMITSMRCKRLPPSASAL